MHGVGGQRIQREQFREQRIPAGLRDDIPRERLARHVGAGPGGSLRIEYVTDTGKVSSPCRQGGNGRNGTLAQANAPAFVAAEQERLVFTDRTSQRTAELVLPVFGFTIPGAVGEEVGTVELVVTQELERGAVQ